MKSLLAILVFFSSLNSGCLHMSSRSYFSQVLIANRSMHPILTVTLDPDGKGTSFGYLGPGGKGKTTAGYALSFSDGLVVEWKENGKKRRSTIDLTGYARKRRQIQSMSFYYLGDGRWQVVAQDGLDPGSRVVSP